VGFEPTIAVLERAKTVRALDRSATAIGTSILEIIFVKEGFANLIIQIRIHNIY
jgi:hypothetical protein